MKFTGTNVLVTGSSRGIGASIAKVLASYGLKVWINYRNSTQAADRVKKDIEKIGGNAAVLGFDVTNEEAFQEAVENIIECDGKLSYLVNNAGITKDRLALRMSAADFQTVLDANLTSAFIGCKEAFRVMSKKRFGSVVNISSIVGEMGNAGQTNYAASKGGMIAMSKSFAKEAAARNLRYNCVTPGFIATDMTNEITDEQKKYYEDKIPLKRMGKAEEIAEVVAFLLSDSSAYITGETLRVNGGLYT